MDFFGISLACLDPDGCMVRGSYRLLLFRNYNIKETTGAKTKPGRNIMVL
jgi:hypothetical protein